MSRAEKVAEEIKKVAGTVVREDLRDPRLGFTTITRVILTDDLRFARIFFSVYGSQKQWEDTEEALTHAATYVRRAIGEALSLRFVPEIVFKPDHSVEYGIRIEEELERLKAAPPEKKEEKTHGPSKTRRRVTKKRK
jgi:ribosome-binding factor A